MYLKLISRQLLRNKTNTGIKIASLVIGLLVSSLIFFLIANWYSFDTFYPDTNRMYRIGDIWNNRGEIDDSPIISAPIAQALKDNIAEVEDYALIRKAWDEKYVTAKKELLNAQSIFADSSFFHFFDFPIVATTTQKELSDAYKIWLSESMAKKFYGNKNALGKIIYDYNETPYEVEGIFKDIPDNCHLHFDMVVSFETLRKSGTQFIGWGGGDSFNGYIKLVPGADKSTVEAKIPDVIKKYYNPTDLEKSDNTDTYYLQSIKDITTVYSEGNSILIKLMESIGIIVLLISVLNFILLSLNSFQKRLYMLGIQQHSGASKINIIQFVSIEQSLLVTISIFIALALLNPMSEIAQFFWGWDVTVSYNGLSLLFIACVLIFVLLLSIGIPFLHLANIKFRLALIHKGNHNIKNSWKKILLSTQMVGATALLIFLFMVIKQLNYIQTLNLGYLTEFRVYVPLSGKQNKENASYLLEQCKQMSYIKSTGLSNSLIIDGLGGCAVYLDEKNENYRNSRFLVVDDNYIRTMGLKVTQGQDFSTIDHTEENIAIVNKSFAKMMNWDNPVGQVFYQSHKSYHVIGVTNNFISNAYTRKQPVIYLKIPENKLTKYADYLSLSLNKNTTLDQVKKLRDFFKKNSELIPLELNFYDEAVKSSYNTEETVKKTLTFFSVLAIFLAVIGLAGYISNEVQQRIKEIGIRKVNGAKIIEILVLLNNSLSRWFILAFIIAIPISYFSTYMMLQFYAFKTNISWWVFALSGALVFSISVIIVSLQSWKAAVTNPVEALRNE